MKAAELGPIVNVKQGALRGIKCVDFQGGSYYSFYGIPYAKPPLGNLRFKSPLPPENWPGTRDATYERERCISRHPVTFEIAGGEDCLFLNVYTRQLPNFHGELSKSVMVWLHGGAFSYGSTETDLFGPDFLITEDVVLVTVSFRLGPLGFLCLEDASLGVPGNASFRDVIMALKWLKANVACFGGDPENVTLFAVSSGAVTAHYLMLSPLCKGLFHKVILQSGTSLMHWAIGARDSAKHLAALLGCESQDEREILSFLQATPVGRLFEGRVRMKNPIGASVPRHFHPVMEKRGQAEAAVIDREPLEVILEGAYNKMPMMLGYTSEEGMMFEAAMRERPTFFPDYEDVVPHTLMLKRGSYASKLVARKIYDFYFGGRSPTLENLDRYIRLQSDSFFMSRTVAAARYHAKNLGHSIFFYRFSVDAGLNIYKKLFNATLPGAMHSDEIPYLFKMSLTPRLLPGSIEEKTVRRMVRLWANFSRGGDPNGASRGELIGVEWKPLEVDLVRFLDIGENLSTGANPDGDRVAFWDEIYNLDPVLAKL